MHAYAIYHLSSPQGISLASNLKMGCSFLLMKCASHFSSQVTTLVPRRRGLLQRCLRAVPMVVVWPVTVSIIMTYLGRR